MKEYYVYMLLCSDDTYYIGITNNLNRRYYEHRSGYNPNSYTHNRRPIRLVYSCEFNDVNEAIAWEKQIKNWSQAKKRALIKRDWDEVKKSAECKNSSCHKNYNPRES